MATSEARVLAQALYEIRLLLGDSLGSDAQADINVRTAAHLAYALHNDAQAILDGRGFNVAEAVKRVAAINSVLGGNSGAAFVRKMPT